MFLVSIMGSKIKQGNDDKKCCTKVALLKKNSKTNTHLKQFYTPLQLLQR